MDFSTKGKKRKIRAKLTSEQKIDYHDSQGGKSVTHMKYKSAFHLWLQQYRSGRLQEITASKCSNAVIGHGIRAGNILTNCCDLLNSQSLM
jgi:hypothetical protein